MSELDIKDYSRCCDYCLLPFVVGTTHCNSCHETFANYSTTSLFVEHFHKLTRGCRWPGNIEDFYRKEGIWHKKEKKLEEEDTPAQSRNSNSSRGAAKRSTSNGSRDRKYRDDRQLGQSWE